MANRTNWAPLDVRGEIDMSQWVHGVSVFLTQRTLAARSLATGEGLILLAGSQLATSTAPTLQTAYAAQRSQLQDDGDVTLDADRFTLTRHLHFRSPSAAASVVSGSNTNGRHAWRTATGVPLSDLTRM